MRHLAVAEPCPIDRRPAGRRSCSGCRHFVSFRSSPDLDTIGCAWGEDTVAWLRREMVATPPPAPMRARATRPAVITRGPRRSDGTTLAVVAAAVGLGLLLSALERRPGPGRAPRLAT